nr:immunoglobulin heavy chain junction region [Mus musculus]
CAREWGWEGFVDYW